MSNILLSLFMIIYQVKCLNKSNKISELLNSNLGQIYSVIVGYAFKIFIEYNEGTYFCFDIIEKSYYQVNIHSINCNIKIDFNGELMNQINLDTYSIKINEENICIRIKPLMNIIDGEEMENYQLKTCYLSINSININKPEINYQKNEGSIFYFRDYDILKISYELERYAG